MYFLITLRFESQGNLYVFSRIRETFPIWEAPVTYLVLGTARLSRVLSRSCSLSTQLNLFSLQLQPLASIPSVSVPPREDTWRSEERGNEYMMTIPK